MKSPLIVKKQEVSKIEEKKYIKFISGFKHQADIKVLHYIVKQYFYKGMSNYEFSLPSWVFRDNFDDLSELEMFLRDHRFILQIMVERYWE